MSRLPAPSRRPSLAPIGSTGRHWIITALALMVAVTGLTALAGPASAATVYEITGRWAPNTPGQLSSGDVVTAEWRVNLNDDQPAPSNDPVDNVTFEVTLENGEFDELPDICLTAGVDPVSSISADRQTLTCNVGTKDQGTAVAVQTLIVADGPTGSELSATGSIAGQTASPPPIPINNPFGMDIRWGVGTPYFAQGAGFFDMDLQWTLSKDRGGEAGPQSITYDLAIASPQGGAVQVGPNGCTPFTTYAADGHPWSGGAHPANQTAPFVGTCQLVQTGPTTFQLTLTGIDYDPAAPPTLDSAGNRLPTDEVALASGSIWVRVMTSAAGGLQLTSNAPTYTSVSGQTAQDDPANNTESKAWTTPGTYSSGWGRSHTGSGGTTWDLTYQVSAGTTVAQYMDTGYGTQTARADNLPVGMCSALDTRYVTFDFYVWPNPVPGAVIEYYTGSNPALNPTSGSYDPSAFDCGATDGGWSTTAPADPDQVRAFRVTMTQGAVEAHPRNEVIPLVLQTIRPDTPIGTDVWSHFSGIVDFPGGPAWWNPFGDPAGCINDTPPGYRYACTTGFSDVVRIIGATPAILKSADRSTVTPGVPATFSLTYSANGAGAIPATVDDYEIVDTLPTGMSYVAGSATPEPQVSVDGQGRQVLTWSLDGVPTNNDNVITYRAVAEPSVTPGQTLTNSAVASVGGVTTAPATAQVSVTTNGYTTIGKAADTPFIPNLDGNGDGEGSWTVTVRSFDPLPQSFTDTIDILPFEGDQRGTDFEGTYDLTGVDALDGQVVYYTTTDPATLSDDPAAPANGAPNAPSAIWSTTFTPGATAVRVIGPTLPAGDMQQFRVRITTDGAEGEDLFVNRAQGRAGHTELVMRTSAPISVANYYSVALKKYVQDANGDWRDANDVTEYPSFRYGDTVRYRIVVENTGQGMITNLEVTDDQRPDLGNFTVASLAPGESESHEFEFVLDESTNGTVVNTACGTADVPGDSQVPPTINCDPAGFEVANYTTVKSADPRSGRPVLPGDRIDYTITVTQHGTAPAEAEFTDDLSKVLDDARYNRDVRASLGTVRHQDGHIIWNGTIPVGEVARITYSVTVKGTNQVGNRRLVNPVTSAGCEVRDGETVNCRTEHRVGKVDLRIDKRVVGPSRVPVGDSVRYRLQVTNNGPDTARPPITITDPLPRGLQAVSASGRGWECRVNKASDTISCVRDQSLGADRKAQPVFVTARTTRSVLGRSPDNTATVSAAGDTVRSNNRDTAEISVVRVPPAPNTGYRHLRPELF